jgi:orotidine-5'-phosphate decarboxylase
MMQVKDLLKNPIILALDVDTDTEAYRILDSIGDDVGAIKIGPRLNLKYGLDFIQTLKKIAPVFIDNKYFDITSTVLAAIQTSFDSGATFVTIHALNGVQTLKAVAELEQKLNAVRPFKVLCVTILTSWSRHDLLPNFVNVNLDQHVTSLIKTVEESGLSGIVCSGQELTLIKSKDLFRVVPGIRLESDNDDDQKRVITPKQAMHYGADALVIGRTILKSKSPKDAIRLILENLETVHV